MKPEPVVVLATPHSQAAHVAALIGGHPRAFALPEMRLFAAERVSELLALSAHGDARGNDGLLRAVAYLFHGGQSAADIDHARRFLERRADWSTAALFELITDRLAPRTAVFHDLSAPLHIIELDRWRATAAGAAFIHLMRHPVTFVEAATRVMRERLYIPPDYSDHTGHPQLRPEVLWFRVHDTLERELGTPRCRRLRLEDLQAALDDELGALCRWLGWADDATAVHRMSRTAAAPFGGPGPRNAPGGAEADFLSAPRFVTPLGARADSGHLRPSPLSADVTRRAQRFGYG